MKTEKRILKLTITRKWADAIINGGKLEEYREISPFYQPRMWLKTNAASIKREYDEIHFFVGKPFMSYDHPHFKVKWNGFYIGNGKPEWGAKPGTSYYCIDVSEILEVKFWM